jgi:hypothetical protein
MRYSFFTILSLVVATTFFQTASTSFAAQCPPNCGKPNDAPKEAPPPRDSSQKK